MKVIDILNKIANGEEVRFKLLSDGNVFKLTKGSNLYNETQKEEVEWWIYKDWLNEEVEIIEEDKKIGKIPYQFSLDYIYCNINETAKKEINKTINEIYDKINEIIDYLNKEEE